MWKSLAMIFVGRVPVEIAPCAARAASAPIFDWRATSWIWPWLIGPTLISVLGRYGHGHTCAARLTDLPVPSFWFSLGIFYYAVEFSMSEEQVQAALAKARTGSCPVPKRS